MILKQLLKSISWSHLRNEKLKSFLTILGMSLGITVYVAIRLSNQSIYESFEASANFFSEDHQFLIASDQKRISENNIKKLLSLPAIKSVSPLSHSYLEIRLPNEQKKKIHVVGIDVFQLKHLNQKNKLSDLARDKILLLLKSPYALASPSLWRERDRIDDSLNLLAGSNFKKIKLIDSFVSSTLSKTYGDDYILCDISVYQKLLDEYRYVDQLFVNLKNGYAFDKTKEEVRLITRGDYNLVGSDEQSKQSKKITAAFQLNLNFLAVISLLVSILLVYNSISFAVLKRRKEIGTLLSIGASPKAVFALIMTETFFIGLAASVIGFIAGYFLSALNIKMMTQTITTLYFPISTELSNIPILLVLECLILGPILALIGAFIPCLEIFRVPPRDTFGYQDFEERFEKWIPLITFFGILFLTLAFFSANKDYLKIHLFFGFLSPAFTVMGLVACIPLSLIQSISFLKKTLVSKAGIELTLALDHIRMTIQRNTVAIASAMIAIGMFLGVSMMIISFRSTVTEWINHVTKADIFVSTPYPITGDPHGYLPDNLVTDLITHEQVKDYDWISGTKVKIDDHIYTLMGVRYETIIKYQRLLLKSAMTQTYLADALKSPDSILVSETFSNRTGKDIGDSFSISGSRETKTFKIVNIFYDYSTDQGVAYLSAPIFENLFGEERKQGVALYLKDPKVYPRLKEEILSKYPKLQFVMRDNHSLRNEVMSIFDQTFQITHALQWIALLIAALTILNTILMLTFERNREFAVMRAIGASSTSIIKMVATESLFLGFASVTGGILLGLALALILVFVVNQFFFAWTVHFEIPYRLITETFFGAIILSIFSGLLPSLRLTKKLDAKALRYE